MSFEIGDADKVEGQIGARKMAKFRNEKWKGWEVFNLDQPRLEVVDRLVFEKLMWIFQEFLIEIDKGYLNQFQMIDSRQIQEILSFLKTQKFEIRQRISLFEILPHLSNLKFFKIRNSTEIQMFDLI